MYVPSEESAMSPFCKSGEGTESVFEKETAPAAAPVVKFADRTISFVPAALTTKEGVTTSSAKRSEIVTAYVEAVLVSTEILPGELLPRVTATSNAELQPVTLNKTEPAPRMGAEIAGTFGVV